MVTIEVVDMTDDAKLEADGGNATGAMASMDAVTRISTGPDALIAKTRSDLFDAAGKQFGAALKRPTISATARAQIQAAKQLFDAGEVEKGLEAFRGVGVKPTASYLIKHGDKLALALLRRCTFNNAAMPEKLFALHQVIVAYKAAKTAQAYDKLAHLGLILEDRGMIELAFLIDAALREGRASASEFPV